MKTARTTRGRRSSLLSVKSPILRRNPRRSATNVNKDLCLTHLSKVSNKTKFTKYISPLEHLKNSQVQSSNKSTKDIKKGKSKKSIPKTKKNKENDIKSNSSDASKSHSANDKKSKALSAKKSPVKATEVHVNESLLTVGSFFNQLDQLANENSKDANETTDNTTSSTISNEDSCVIDNSQDETVEEKFKKMGNNKEYCLAPKKPLISNDCNNTKSGLSTQKKSATSELTKRIKESPAPRLNAATNNIFSDSVIVIDDVETIESAPGKLSNIKHTEVTDEVMMLDCTDIPNADSSTEHYQNILNYRDVSVSKNIGLDSVIVIDDDSRAGDETECSTNKDVPKRSESKCDDCFVVWSSLPTSSNSSNATATSSSAANSELVIAEQTPLSNLKKPMYSCKDKIFLDTHANTDNLKVLIHENTKSVKCKKSRLVKTNNKVTKSAASKATVKKNPIQKAKALVSARKKVKEKVDLIYQASKDTTETRPNQCKKGTLRKIVIDGMNVAMAHTNGKNFSEKGIQMVINYFTTKGHEVIVFLPQYKRARSLPLLEKWHEQGIVAFTPSRTVGKKHINSYDDRYILEYATLCKGIVVSRDQFRDLYQEKPEYRETIEKRILVPTFVGDIVMFPEDPLGRSGPTLAQFLKH